VATTHLHTNTFADGNVGCSAGVVFAIDLVTGRTLWEWVHPWMKFNDDCASTCFIDVNGVCADTSPYDSYEISQFFWDWGQCEMGIDESADIEAKTVYAPKADDGVIYELRRGSMIGPATINHDMVFIPTMTGEIYVHSILDGEYIGTIYCPEYEHENAVGTFEPNREGTRSGQTMFEDYLIFYCGGTFVHPTDGDYMNSLLQQGAMVVMQLNANSQDESDSVSDSDSMSVSISNSVSSETNKGL